ncbi:hypothetical protein ABPG72_006548 [Tetrahymena utriculariae]
MNQKCICCGILSDELNCYNCYKKIRNVFVPSPQVMSVQKKFIEEHSEILKELAKEKFQDLVNLNTIERISIYQKKLFETKDDIQDLEEFKQMIQIQTKEIEITNQYKKKQIELLKVYLENQKPEQKKAKEELEKRQNIYMHAKKIKVEMAYNLRVINYQFPNWSVNNELEKIEIPFQNKKSNQIEKSYQNYILFKKKWNFLTQVQQQQFIFSMNQIALFIYSLQTIFKISSQFPLQKKPREQISITTENIKIYDENFRIFYDENIIYLYLNYKLILQRFNINRTRNPYFFFDFCYFKERFFARQNVIEDQKEKFNLHSNNVSYQQLKIASQDSQEALDLSFLSYTDLCKQKEDKKIIDINLLNNTHDCLEQTIKSKVICNTPQKSLIINNLAHSDQLFAIPQENLRIRSLCDLEETFKQINENQNHRNQIKHNLNQDQGKTFRLLFIKSPLIKIEYEDNLKQKEFGFKDPYIYASKKVVSGGWELYDNEEQ